MLPELVDLIFTLTWGPHTVILLAYDGVILIAFSVAIVAISGIIVKRMTQIATLTQKSTCEMFGKEIVNIVVPTTLFLLATAWQMLVMWWTRFR